MGVDRYVADAVRTHRADIELRRMGDLVLALLVRLLARYPCLRFT